MGAIKDLSKLCLHTITTKQWTIEEDIAEYSKAGIKGISVWRNALEGRDIKELGNQIRDSGMEIVSLVRGGFFPNVEKSLRDKAITENKQIVEEAVLLGAPMIVLVCGADPAQSLEQSRNQIKAGIEALVPLIEEKRIRLAIEPLHPMYADTRSAVNTMKQANEIAESISSEYVGVAVDVYHTWWDPDLQDQIMRCGQNGNLFAFHICDWVSPTTDMLNDRGIMGEGCIPIRKIRNWVEAAGFDGFNEVEIFSNRHWKRDPNEYLKEIIKQYYNC